LPEPLSPVMRTNCRWGLPDEAVFIRKPGSGKTVQKRRDRVLR
jgi:hypothetical protein